MSSASKRMIRTAVLTVAILILAASGIHGIHFIPAFASGTAGSNSPSFFAEEGGQDNVDQGEGGQDDGGEGQGGQGEEGGQDDTSSVASEEEDQQDTAELLRQFSARVKAALDELESHARAMIAAGNVGDRQKYDSEQKAYENAGKLFGRALVTSDGIPYDDASPIVEKAYDRFYSIETLHEQAETALANSLGGAMDEDGNIYSISKVSVKISQVGKSDDMYDAALQAIGDMSNEKENQLVYKISLFVGKKPARLLGGLTKSVTIGIPGDKIGKAPVNSYYLSDGDDGNQGAPVAEKRGYFNKATWCLTVKVNKYVTYYVVCGEPGTKGDTGTKKNTRTNSDEYEDDVVAIQGKNQQITLNELREMISAVLLEDGNAKKARALEAIKAEGKTTAVYEIVLPEDVTLLPDTDAVVDIVCSKAAEKTVEIYRISEKNEAEWIETVMANRDGTLRLTTDKFGVFVLCWHSEAEKEVSSVITPTDAESEQSSAPVFMIIIGLLAAAAVIGGGTFLVIRSIKK